MASEELNIMSSQLEYPSAHYINGEWRESTDDRTIDVNNPTTEEVLGTVPDGTGADVAAAIEAANEAQHDWAHRPAPERGDFVRQIAEVIEANREELARLVTAEQGKPISAAKGEIDAAAEIARYNAEWDRRIEGDILPGDVRDESIHLQRHPKGTVVGIIPWNYPIVVLLRKLAPALVAGNSLVAKPSEITPLSTVRLFEHIDESMELPEGVCNLVTGAGETGAALVESPDIDMISMTGSVETGKAIMRNASINLTDVSLELGGKAPAIVWKDADIDRAIEDVLTARITNTGQVCTCAERVFVHADIRDEFEEKYVRAAQAVQIGNPMDDAQMGPQVSADELEKTERAVAGATDAGARVLTGGNRLTEGEFSRGYWYEPTVLSDVGRDMDIMQREVFGPVTPIMPISSMEEAISAANDSEYGLSSYLFTNDYRLAMRVAEDLDFGETYINRTLGESWHAHHTGWKESGLGGEDGKYGFLKYTQLKTVYHNYS